jgi:hypothetical protein
MRLPAENTPEWSYATRAREMEFRTLWIEAAPPPIPKMPRRWRGHDLFKFAGFALPLRQFAITRFVEAQQASTIPVAPHGKTSLDRSACLGPCGVTMLDSNLVFLCRGA